MSAEPIFEDGPDPDDWISAEPTLDELASLCAAAPMNAGALASLELLKPEAMSTQAGRVDTLVALRRAAAWVAAAQQKVMVSLAAHAGESGFAGDKLWIREDIAAALSISPAHAGSLLDTADRPRPPPRSSPPTGRSSSMTPAGAVGPNAAWTGSPRPTSLG